MKDDIIAKLQAALEPTPAPRTEGIATISLDGLNVRKPAGKTKTEYPELDEPEAQAQAQAFLAADEQVKAATADREFARGSLIAAAEPLYWKVNRGLAEPHKAVSIVSPAGEVLVQFKDAYKKVQTGNLGALGGLPKDVLAAYFEQRVEITIDSAQIPADRVQTVIAEVVALANRLNIGPAVAASTHFAPKPEWHAVRHRILTPADNLKLEQAFGEKRFMTIAVSAARGRKS